MKPHYSRKDPIPHILHRPDMYVGSTRERKQEEFVVIDDELRIGKREIMISPAIIRIFIEPLSNIMDNITRSKQGKNKVTQVRVTIDKETGLTTFWNDGEVIPIEIHETEKCYNHSLIFGQLLTGSNYDDTEDREDISGRNGLGVKLSCVFSKSFTVEGTDPNTKLKLIQTWTNNMRETTEPKIEKYEEKTGYTWIKYTPDFSQFGIKGYTQDILNLYLKYLVDSSMITKVDFYFNNRLIPVKNLQEYAQLYSPTPIEEILTIKMAGSEVVVTPSSNEFQVISFANGIYTPLGGTHVDAWCEALFRPIVDKMNKPKSPQINIKDVKNLFRLFVVATVKKPEFDNQSKLKLESPQVYAEVKKNHITALSKWSVIAQLEELIRQKDLSSLKKMERKTKYVKIEGLDSANFEGSAKANECILILVEGDSAKSYAVAGIQTGAFGKAGRDYFGIYKLRGKVLNTRNASTDMIAKNAIVDDIIKALGLKMDVDYTIDENYKKLRYGQVLVITDADVDGIHITGLIQNLFHSLFPSVLQREKPFLTAMQTLIGKVNIGRRTEYFYNEQNFRKFLDENRERIKKDSVKYYKGLATNNEEEVPDTFGKKLVNFIADEKCNESMNLAFHKKFTDERKEWLKTFDNTNDVMNWESGNSEEIRELPLTNFIEKELIKFSLDDCGRSLPNLMDGLKTSQRKILYGTILRNLKYNSKVMKVAQLGSAVAELTAYHHGEQNLVSTIIGMAQSFIGSNNIPLLFRDGQFGSRVQGGKDAGAGRYIYTKQDELTRLLFRPEDDSLLTYLDVDGEKVEPEFFVPILPTILVNGASGIGTGWSCDIPLYNPLDIINSIRIWLREKGKVFISTDNGIEISLLPRLVPWYREFTGRIEMTSDPTKFLTHGRVDFDKKKYVISELPVGVWTNDYKEFLETLLEDKRIAKLENHSNLREVKFSISEGTMKLTPETLNLTSSLRTTNMCIFDDQNQLRKFENTEQIIDAFCKVRYVYYTRRRERLILDTKHQIALNENKRRFLLELIAKTISLSTELNEARPTDEIERELRDKNYYCDPESGGFAYLLNMQLRSVTRERINNLADEILSLSDTLNRIEQTNETAMWLSDLEEFEKVYEKWLPKIRNEKVKEKKK